MTKEAIMKLQTYKLFEDGELLVCRDDVLKLLEQEPCEDAVSRQAVLNTLDKRFDSIPVEQTTEILLLRKDLRELPSVTLYKVESEE